MVKKITIIGAGPGGYIAAIRAAQLGAEVTVIEEENVGGTCLNRGCIPSKIMKTSAEILEKFKRAPDFGLAVDGKIGPDMQLLMDRKQKIIQDQIKGILRLLDHHRIRLLKGKGFIKGPNRTAVHLADGKTVEILSDRLILAMGSQPLEIPLFPFDGKRILSSNDALDLRELPESMLILGGGVIGCEFGFIFSSFGTDVTIVEALSRLLPLPSVDEDCSRVIQREMKKRKMKFMLNRTAECIDIVGGKCRVTIGPSLLNREAEKDKTSTSTIEVDQVLLCTGRKPNSSNTGLESLGAKIDEKGWVHTNERLETRVPGVYAIGDLLGPSRPMLAHVASREAIIAAENAMGEDLLMNYDVVPCAVFTMPEVANVGLTEAQAWEQGYHVRSETVLFRNLGKAQVIGEIAGQAKIVSDAENGKILGVHLLGPHATDLIAEGALAVKLGCTVKDLAETIHAHPTLAEIMMEVSFKGLDRSLHG